MSISRNKRVAAKTVAAVMVGGALVLLVWATEGGWRA